MKSKYPRKNSHGYIPMLIAGVLLIAISVLAAFAIPKATAQVSSSQELGVEPVTVNFAAPEINLTDLEGNPVSIADYRGQVVLYNAWATWCPPCKEEMPILQAYYEDYKDKGFVVIAIEDGEPVDEVTAFVQERGLTFPVWPDHDWVATTAFKLNTLPASFLIDRDGVVRMMWNGPVTRESLEKYVTPMLVGN